MTDEMKAAETLESTDFSLIERLHKRCERIARRNPLSVAGLQTEVRPAVGTGRGLRMKAAVGRILVFGSASLAHHKGGHRGAIAVVRRSANDRETRTAVSAVEKRIAIAPIRRIEQLGQARVARGDVRRDEDRARRIGVAGHDAESDIVCRGPRLPRHVFDPRQRGSRRFELRQKPIKRSGLPLDLDHHVPALVLDETDEAELDRQTVDKRPKADPLHDPLHGDCPPLHQEVRSLCSSAHASRSAIL